MKLKALLTAAALAMSTIASANVTTNIYSGFSTSGGGAPYSGFVGSLNTPGISFATDTGYNWHPFGLGSFGADVMASMTAPADGTYTFHLSSDDGALVFIDSALLIDRGGPHGPSTTDGTLFLAAGTHAVEVQFFECCGGPSGLDFAIPTDIILGPPPASIPEPGTLLLLSLGAAGGWFGTRRRA